MGLALSRVSHSFTMLAFITAPLSVSINVPARALPQPQLWHNSIQNSLAAIVMSEAAEVVQTVPPQKIGDYGFVRNASSPPFTSTRRRPFRM